MTPKRTILIATVSLAILAVATIMVRSYRKSSPAGTDIRGAADRASFSSLGNFYDWVTGRGPLAESMAKLTTEPLIEVLTPDRILMRIAAEASFRDNDRSGLIELRNDVYWSDGRPLLPEHYLDGFNHAKSAVVAGSFSPTEIESRWLRTLTPAVNGKTGLILSGFSDQKDFEAFLVSSLARPVRKDLLQAEQPTAGWDITFGRYAPVFPASDSKASTLSLKPNMNYYRGSADKTVSLDITGPGKSH